MSVAHLETTKLLASHTQDLQFGLTDFIVFTIMLLSSAGIGIYFGFFSKAKNTTDEFLMGGKKMKTFPIAVSLVASQLSGIAIISVPVESYSFGFTHIFLVLSIFLVVPILNYIIVPVFYENNISNCYEYLELRFNKQTRQLITIIFILNVFMMLPVYMFIPSLAFSQVTGININLINTVVSSICVFYTMLGGIKAVVWTDVVQGSIMLFSVIMVACMGVMKIGGLSAVLDLATAGGRLDMDLSWDPRVRLTVWNAFFCGIFMWTGHIGLNQSCVQRIVSLPSISHARRSLFIAGIGFLIIMCLNSFTGIIMFARYYGCDPMVAGLVNKADKMMPFFVQDIMGHLLGMPGIFISCVFSAALSTLSANLNSVAGVLYFDYIKSHIKHTDARANAIMRIFIIAMGLYCIAGGFVVQQFNSILQTVLTILGVSTGGVVGIFLLGMFVPRANGKIAVTATIFCISIMLWIVVNFQIGTHRGYIQYDPLPKSLEQCDARGFTWIISKNITKNMTITTAPQTISKAEGVTTAFDSDRPFSITEISFYWYKVLGVFLVLVWSLPLCFILPVDKCKKLNPKLFTPLVRKYLKVPDIQMEELPLKKPIAINENDVPAET